MLFSIGLLIIFVVLAYKAAPREKEEDVHVHGAGQIGLLAALALFGVDYFTSYFYATGEIMGALHPYGLQHRAYIAVVLVALTNLVLACSTCIRWACSMKEAVPTLPPCVISSPRSA